MYWAPDRVDNARPTALVPSYFADYNCASFEFPCCYDVRLQIYDVEIAAVGFGVNRRFEAVIVFSSQRCQRTPPHSNFSNLHGQLLFSWQESILTSRLIVPTTLMDPLTAIGLAANILAFIDFGAK